MCPNYKYTRFKMEVNCQNTLNPLYNLTMLQHSHTYVGFWWPQDCFITIQNGTGML